MSLTEEQWQQIRDHDSVYLVELGDALSTASAAVMEGMYANGLRIVHDDRTDPPYEDVLWRIGALIARWDVQARHRHDVDIGEAIGELCKLTKPTTDTGLLRRLANRAHRNHADWPIEECAEPDCKTVVALLGVAP